jgi:hypothetical protein
MLTPSAAPLEKSVSEKNCYHETGFACPGKIVYRFPDRKKIDVPEEL